MHTNNKQHCQFHGIDLNFVEGAVGDMRLLGGLDDLLQPVVVAIQMKTCAS
jgi:hypothetical protein